MHAVSSTSVSTLERSVGKSQGSLVILKWGILFACRQFLPDSLPLNEVLMPLSGFSVDHFPLWAPGVPFSTLSVGKPYVWLVILKPRSLFACRQFLKVSLPSSKVLVPVSGFSGDRFPFRTPGGPFDSLSVGKTHVLLVIL